MNTNFKVTGLTRLGTKAESTASEGDTFTTRPSEQLNFVIMLHLLHLSTRLRRYNFVDLNNFLDLICFLLLFGVD